MQVNHQPLHNYITMDYVKTTVFYISYSVIHKKEAINKKELTFSAVQADLSL